MLGVSQQRVSQLVKSGVLVAERDTNGALQYDRFSVEQFALTRAVARAHPSEAEERKLMQAEARERFARERKARERAQREEREHILRLAERAVDALERIARRPC